MGRPKIIEFHGVTYYLLGRGKYYLSQSKSNSGRKNPKGLHVAIWEYEAGMKIPKGYEIHHIDGNSFNNDITNLVCIPRKEHLRLHMRERLNDKAYREKNKDDLDRARDKANEWHKSEEGRRWHREQARNRKLVKKELVCKECGSTFMSPFSDSLFCSEKCGRRYRKRTILTTSICEQCGSGFVHSVYNSGRFCCKSCQHTYVNLHRPGFRHKSEL